jgi:hypothetical protein
MFIALAALKRWKIHHLDVVTAFLHGLLKEEVYFQQPPRFEILGKDQWVYRLNRSLYGLRQSSRAWYNRIDQYLQSIGMNKNKCDHNLYYKGKGAHMVILVLYVDDLFITVGGGMNT